MRRRARALSAVTPARRGNSPRAHRTLFGLACLCVLGLTALLGTGVPAAGANGGCENEAFRTGASAHLPDCRAYEMVSPLDKNGGNVQGDSSRTRAAVTGGAVQFAAAQAFADPQGTGLAVDYIARRDAIPGTQGWSTHGITPLQEPLSAPDLIAFGFDMRYMGEFSDDLSRGVFLARSLIGEEGAAVAALRNLYLRTDLLAPGAGSYQLLSDCKAPPAGPCASPLSPNDSFRPGFADATDDFGHVIFESRFNLATGATGNLPKLYEWDHGTLRLAGILPGETPAASSAAGRGAGASGSNGFYTHGTISMSGSRIVFTSPVTAASMGNASSSVYQRVDHTETIKLNLEESSGDPAPSQATFWTATPDGERVFFTTAERLVDQDPAESNPDLYRWDAQAGTEVQQLSIEATGGSFVLTFDGESTDPLLSDASAGDVQAELNGLGSVGGAGGSVSVTGGSGSYAVEFGGALAETHVDQIEIDATGLDPSAVVDSSETRHGGHLTLISVDEVTADQGDVRGAIGASDDGDRVYFVSQSQIDDEGTTDCKAVNPCVFLWDDGDVRQVARINASREGFATIGAENWLTTVRKSTRVTPDGEKLLFVSEGTTDLDTLVGMPGYDHGASCTSSPIIFLFGDLPACAEVYLYEADGNAGAGELTCVSCNPSGVHGTPTDAGIDTRSRGNAAAGRTPHLTHPLSDDGRYVFFHTGESLVPADKNDGAYDVYRYDTATGTRSLLSTGTSQHHALFMDASADGTDVFIRTRERLVGWDTDGQIDLYDARAGGGFAEPEPPPPPCAGEACLGPAAASPAAHAAPGTATLAGRGNADARKARNARKRCGRNARRVTRNGRARCVKKTRKHKRPNANRRAGR